MDYKHFLQGKGPREPYPCIVKPREGSLTALVSIDLLFDLSKCA